MRFLLSVFVVQNNSLKETGWLFQVYTVICSSTQGADDSVFDHVEHKYTKGFRMLTLGWSDGNSFLPLSQCLLSSTERENRLQEASTSNDRII